MKTISTVGVVGAGTMGAALAQKFAQEGLRVFLMDRTMEFVERGLASISRTLQEGIERKILTPEGVSATLARIRGTETIADLSECDLVVEAIYEDLQAKTDLFKRLSDVVRPTCILATNTSSFSVTELANAVQHPERFCGLHYFYHAAKNRLVEIVAGQKTAEETVRTVERFSFMTGKDPIFCTDRHGFAVNRFFVPWLNEAVRLLDAGIATIPMIDAVCMKTFGVGMGPFALMNATGVPIAYHAQRTLESLGTLYVVADRLAEQAESHQPWELGDAVALDIDEATAQTISERMMGIVFLVCGQILDEGVCSPTDLNRGARIGLKWHSGPIEMMRSIGRDEVERLIRKVATLYQTPFPRGVRDAFEPLEYVSLKRQGATALITITRPEDLNALNEDVVSQLGTCFDTADKDESCDTIVITGSGKSFVAGADISLFVDHIRSGTIDGIVDFTARTHQVFERIDRSAKRVIAILNGMALGGGLELALCADVIYALPGAVVAFPETGIGIYPGLGGTQRTQRRIGKGLTKYMIYTGDAISAQAAMDMGLIDGVISASDYCDIRDGKPIESIEPIRGEKHDARWKAIDAFFNAHTLETLFTDNGQRESISADEIDRWRKRVGQKAPIALRTAERLVDEARGCASELEHLTTVFRSNDALLGLSSVGRKVSFNGN